MTQVHVILAACPITHHACLHNNCRYINTEDKNMKITFYKCINIKSPVYLDTANESHSYSTQCGVCYKMNNLILLSVFKSRADSKHNEPVNMLLETDIMSIVDLLMFSLGN